VTHEPVVLVVEDEPAMRRFLRASLTSHGFKLVEAAGAREAMGLASSRNPEIVLLDLGLPDGDGIDFTRQLREWTQVPIIVLSARGQESDKVAALDAGADDYVTKPFGVAELLARMRVALRRAQRASGGEGDKEVTVGPLCVDFVRRVVTLGGAEVHLTPIEYRLLGLLAKHVGKVLTHRQMLGEVWGPNHGNETHYLRVYMAQLRRKLERDPARPALLVTEPGVGYRLREPEVTSPRAG
jgi:two-component system, OmpR family, KDP operon response regulator KdpE